MPSRDFTSEDLFSSRMMSMQSSTHSSQMKTVGPAISLRTSCWLLPQKEQYKVLLESPLAAFVMVGSHSLGDPTGAFALNHPTGVFAQSKQPTRRGLSKS